MITKIRRTNSRRYWLSSVLCTCLTAAPLAGAGEPVRFVDLAQPDARAEVGEQAQVAVFYQAGESGILLINKSLDTVLVEDVATANSVSVAPGMRIGIACSSENGGEDESSASYLSLSAGSDVVYQAVPCGSWVRFTDAEGGNR